MLDTSRVFDRLLTYLGELQRPLLLPDLPLRFGMTPIAESAALLAARIEAAFGAEQPIDLFGFSMGGVIARTWIQMLGGPPAHPVGSSVWRARTMAPSRPSPGRAGRWPASPT